LISRRRFVGAVGLPAVAAASGVTFTPRLGRAATAPEPPRGLTAREVARDEDYWAEVARAFTVDRSLINLNNGGVSPSPAYVQEAMKRHLDYSNEAPTYTMWRILEPQREGVRQRLARAWGVDPEEIALTRNASEGLQICQFGIDLEPGDEVARRFEEAITPRTKLILVCHMINLTGQILPAREVTALGRARGIPVIVDGAHALAHFDFTLGELDVDYYATSLHKWLFAPHGTGLLYVRRERIADLWPLQAAPDTMDDDIRKFEEIGTHPAANYLAIAEALTFHEGIGGARKAARLVYLRDRWAKRLLENDRVRLHTSLKPGFACGIATVAVDGIEPAALGSWLWNEHRIIVTPIGHEECPGLRISPSVYTTPEELDRFCDAVEHAIRYGIPA